MAENDYLSILIAGNSLHFEHDSDTRFTSIMVQPTVTNAKLDFTSFSCKEFESQALFKHGVCWQRLPMEAGEKTIEWN
jgi:hypothetical protein